MCFSFGSVSGFHHGTGQLKQIIKTIFHWFINNINHLLVFLCPFLLKEFWLLKQNRINCVIIWSWHILTVSFQQNLPFLYISISQTTILRLKPSFYSFKLNAHTHTQTWPLSSCKYLLLWNSSQLEQKSGSLNSGQHFVAYCVLFYFY